MATPSSTGSGSRSTARRTAPSASGSSRRGWRSSIRRRRSTSSGSRTICPCGGTTSRATPARPASSRSSDASTLSGLTGSLHSRPKTGRPERLVKNWQVAQKGPDARRRPKAAGEAYSLYVEPAAEGANEADGPFSAACAAGKLGHYFFAEPRELLQHGFLRGAHAIAQVHVLEAGVLLLELLE